MDRKKAADLAYAEGYRLGSASRDAEVAELQKAIDENWVTHQQIVAASKERDQLREQVAILREALLTCSVGDFSTGHVIYPSFDEKLVEEALAATEPKIAKPT